MKCPLCEQDLIYGLLNFDHMYTCLKEEDHQFSMKSRDGSKDMIYRYSILLDNRTVRVIYQLKSFSIFYLKDGKFETLVEEDDFYICPFEIEKIRTMAKIARLFI